MTNRPVEEVERWISPQEVIDLARRLVALPSENPPGNESAVARELGRYLKEAGLIISSDPVFPRRSNLVTRLPGGGGRPSDHAAGRSGGGGPILALVGHSDTMPDGDGWTVDPRGAVMKSGRLYGRGAADMKGGLAAMTAAAAAISRARLPLKGDLLLAAVIDEENQGRGALRLVERNFRADWAVIGEPTGNVPVIVSNGQINFHFTFHGKAGHGSQPECGRNAIYDALRLVDRLRTYAAEVLPGRSHPLVGPASINVGTIQGGVQTSIIPDLCRLTVDRRVAPGETLEMALAEMETLLANLRWAEPGLDVELEVPYCLPPVQVDEDTPVVRALREAARAVSGRDPGFAGMRATTDAAILSGRAGIPTVVCGPGSLTQAHQPDEYIQIDELVDAARIYAHAAVRLLI